MSQIKVLHLFNYYLPHTENWAYQLIKHSPKVEVYIGARRYLPTNFYDPDFTFAHHPFGELDAYYEQLSRYRLPDFFQKVAIKLFRPMLGDLHQQLHEFATYHQVDLVHAHFADVAWYFRTVPERLKIPWVISFYGWDYEQLPYLKPEYHQYFDQMFRTAAAFICEGQHGAEMLAQQGCPPEKIHVVRLGVTPENIPFHQRAKKKNELRLLQIAGFTEKKGQLYTLGAFAKAKKDCPDLRLCLLGGTRSPAYLEAVKSKAKELNIEQDIEFLSGIDYARLYAFMEDYQVFIHPSCYAADRDCEGGAPVVLLDAQASGMPVISTRHCDIPDEVIAGKTGLLAAEKDEVALAEMISRFYCMEEEEYRKFARQARKHVEENYAIKENAKKLSAIYTNLLEKPLL